MVRLAGVAGLVAGAFSMAAGEYVSMQAQRELFQRELELENHEIRTRPEGERRELVRIYESRGVEPDVAGHLASEMMRTPELALETHAREELGINPTALGSPVKAGASSFATFALGALVPLIPWLVTRGTGRRAGLGGGGGGGRGRRRGGLGRLHPTTVVVVGAPAARHLRRSGGGYLRHRDGRRGLAAVH